jgi:glycerophosphoryl diester phosphodiesterase
LTDVLRLTKLVAMPSTPPGAERPTTAAATTVPEIIGHRGASRECLENTFAAFDRAFEQQADGIELDVHATRDGVVVVHHDSFVGYQRSGPGVDGHAPPHVSHEALSALRLLNFEPIPTLDAVLARVGSRGTVYVEIKGTGIEQVVIDCLDRHPGTRSAIHAFDHRISREIGRRRPTTATGILSASYVIDLPHMIRSAGARDLWQHTALIDEALVRDAERARARVIAWTENDVPRARMLASIGVAAICTDTPGAMRAGFAIPR